MRTLGFLLVALTVCKTTLAAGILPCGGAIQAAEVAAGLPPALLGAIGMVESGRVDPVTRRIAPWPWTINIEGVGHFYESREDAVAAVLLAQAAGHRSIDVGCMQVNLMHHPNAFATVEEAFDPRANATYAAAFLRRLFEQTREWGAAAAAYHSQTPGLADDYRRRVVAGWTGAARFGVFGEAPGAPVRRREPEGGYTAEFRARLAQDRADGRAFRAAMGVGSAPDRSSAAATTLAPRRQLQASLGAHPAHPW